MINPEQEEESRYFAKKAAEDYKSGQITKDQMKNKIRLAYKYHDWPYLEELQKQGIGSLTWRWNI